MVITPHALVGAALGRAAPGMGSAFLLGVASHYLLDAIPHDDYSPEGSGGRVALLIDAVLAGRLIIDGKGSLREVAGALGGITPDLIHQLHVRLAEGSRGRSVTALHERWHGFIHAPRPPRPPWGLLTQVAAAGGGLLALVASREPRARGAAGAL